MPAVRPSVLVDALLDAIRRSGGVGAYLSSTERTHPRVFGIEYSGRSSSLWVYIWTLTHGGRPTLPDEYRIQITSVPSPLVLNPRGYTVLMGYYHDLGMFAGFDIQQHRTFTAGSPSVQISVQTLHAGLQNGLAFGRKDNDEITAAARPDQFLNYVLNARTFHRYGADATTLQLLEQAAETGEVEEQSLVGLSVERRTIVAQVTRYAREASFRQQVLDAYQHRCAVTRAQLRLVEAAHILPVPVPGSTEHVTNGIALSPTMHRAYDIGLIYLDETYVMRLNQTRAQQLVSDNLHSGLTEMQALLELRVHLPADRQQWPGAQFIRSGNQHRRIPGYY